MISAKEKIQRQAGGLLFDKVYKYIKNDPAENIIKLIDYGQKLMGSGFPLKNYDAFRDAVRDPENVWNHFAHSIIENCDKDYLKKMLLALGIGAGINGTKTVRSNRDKYNCNIPFIILFDPTSACNMNCKGCWSAEYGHRSSLTLDEMRSIVDQGTELGTHVYMMTGGEPLIRKDDIITLAKENPNCMFLCYTNATMIDDDFCKTMKELGNLTVAVSIEGDELSTDERRGKGAYAHAIKALDLMKSYGLIYGASICYTSLNVEKVTADDFTDLMVEKGVRFAFYFNYMPVGHDADTSLIPTPDQRIHMYTWLREVRNSKSGKPMFFMDFQDDAEYVGGCIAGGRNYFHINSEGDMEPCVFVHFSDSNIRSKTILEGLQSPLFMAYYHNQPFNDNHLRPCPMLENPQYLRMMVNQTGAKSTELIEKEDVETLCAKCDKFASEWQPIADKFWSETVHKPTRTTYYRDSLEANLKKD